MELLDLLKMMKEQDGSDLYLTADAPPSLKVFGHLKPLNDIPLTAEFVKQIAYSIMDEEQKKNFEKKLEMNLAISPPDIGRFRVNIYIQRNNVALVIRNIHTSIPHYSSLGLPETVTKLIMEKRGLLLFVGSTGSGKSTSLASLIDYRNERHAGHIICIEDPIEFVHAHKHSIVSQREVGIDTISYDEALKNTLRQAPDVILIGEIRSRETMENAIDFAETGHLCLSTLHANNANQALDRIINFFPEEKRPQLLLDLSFNLRGIISQRLIPTPDKKRVAAIEIMLGTPLVADLIRRGELDSIKDIMERSDNLGMQTFDMALEKLYLEGKVSLEDALKNADSRNNLKLRIALNNKEPAPNPNASDQTPTKESEKPANRFQNKDTDSGPQLSLVEDD